MSRLRYQQDEDSLWMCKVSCENCGASVIFDYNLDDEDMTNELELDDWVCDDITDVELRDYCSEDCFLKSIRESLGYLRLFKICKQFSKDCELLSKEIYQKEEDERLKWLCEEEEEW